MAPRASGRARRNSYLVAVCLFAGALAIRCGEPDETVLPRPCDIDCEDGNPCTVDVCDDTDGLCEFQPMEEGALCVDGICIAAICEPISGVFPCSERGIRSAIATGGGPYIFSCDGPTTVVTKAEILIDRDVILDGEGNLTVHGNDDHRVFQLARDVTAKLHGFTVTGGRAAENDFNLEPAGGIWNNHGTLTLTNSTVSGNNAGIGGGLLNFGTVTLRNCTFFGNAAEHGGAIFNLGELTIISSTVAGNTADEGSAIARGGPVTFAHVLIDGDCSGNPFLVQPSAGYNIESPADTCNLGRPTDQIEVSPADLKLGPLADNGGGTQTCALGVWSVAVDVIPETSCVVETDQRGVRRPQGNGCDVGAVEWADCDDGRECTKPAVSEGLCESVPVEEGTPCGGGAGTCRGLSCRSALGPVTVSGPSPVGTCEVERLLDGWDDAETAPSIAVDPTNPDHIVGAWTQDLSLGTVSAASFDGGLTWDRVVIPGISACSGGPRPNAIDGRLAFAANGDLYSVSTSYTDVFGRDNVDITYESPSAIVVHKSLDGGRTWSQPKVVVEHPGGDTQHLRASITAGREAPCTLYVGWTQLFWGGFSGIVWTSRTTDCGGTWDEPVTLFTNDRRPGYAFQLLVLPDGSPMAFFRTRAEGSLYAQRSPDGGESWPGEPTLLATEFRRRVVPPDTEQLLRTEPDFFDVAVDRRSGRLVAVWQQWLDDELTTRFGFSSSEDGGMTWSTPMRVDRTPPSPNVALNQVFWPSVEISDNGTIGVTYYNFQNDTFGDGRADTDVWFVHCRPDAKDCTEPESWSEAVRLTPESFDVLRAPFASGATVHGLDLGDYRGLTSIENDFLAMFSVTTDDDPADVVFVRVRVQ